MRNSALLLVIVAGASACAARAQPRASITPVRYECGDLELVHQGEKLLAAESAADGPMVPSSVGWRDGAGDHFVTFPGSTTDIEAVEYIVPADPRRDVIEKTYDTSRGSARPDWRITKQRMCQAQGGYNDAFTRWVGGASLSEINTQLSLGSESAASELVHEALVQANRRYYGHGH